MTSFNWKSAVNGVWTDGSKWTPTGGPTLDAGGGTYSADTAIFDTGADHANGISRVADARVIEVEHDHVAFSDLQAGNDDTGLDLDASAGAVSPSPLRASLTYSGISTTRTARFARRSRSSIRLTMRRISWRWTDLDAWIAPSVKRGK